MYFLYINTLFNSLRVQCSISETVKGNARIRVGVIRITKHDDVIEENYTFFPQILSFLFSKNTHFQKYALLKIRTFKNTYFQKYVLSKLRTFKTTHFQKYALLKIRTFKNTYFQKYALSKIRTFKTTHFQKYVLLKLSFLKVLRFLF